MNRISCGDLRAQTNSMMKDIGFILRENPDSAIDLVCLRCFMTVASVNDESDLSALELSHRCDPAHVRFPLDYEDRMSLPEKVTRFFGERKESPKKRSR